MGHLRLTIGYLSSPQSKANLLTLYSVLIRMGVVARMVLGLIKVVMAVWDAATNWIYNVFTNPAQKLRDYDRILAAPQETIKDGDEEVDIVKPIVSER